MAYGSGDFDRAAGFGSRMLGDAVPQTRVKTEAVPLTLGRPKLSVVSDDFAIGGAATDEQWQERALCAQTDPEAFFPEKGGSTREAKRICMGCEVRDACLEYALAHDERFGIWGGLSERERRRLKRKAA